MAQTQDAGGASDKKRAWPLFHSLAGYRAEFITGDVFAGLTLAAIAIPEQMATARLGSFPPQTGLVVLVVAAVAFAVFGGSRVLSCGADSTITPIFAGGLAAAAAAGSAGYVAQAAALAIMVGLVLAAAGLFRLGWIADLLSVPVTIGFLAGISIHIAISQLPGVLGVPAPEGAILERLATLARGIGGTNPFTLAIGLGVLAAILVSEWIDPRIPGALVGLVAATTAVIAFGLDGRGVAVLGEVKGALPAVALPALSPAGVAGLVPLALIVAMTVMMQT